LFKETMAYKPASLDPSSILDSLFYAYSAIVYCIVIASFLKHYIPQYYR